jgi:methylenetetrahydrofolate dehydrogenase (NADP+)/methenyltetrahydrofolate cyclohydrolase
MQIIDGRLVSAQIQAQIAQQVKEIVDGGRRRPKLAAILVGDDAASIAYVTNKERACAQVGFESMTLRLPSSVSERALLEHVEALNKACDVDGLIVQLPLPPSINAQQIIENIAPRKDADGFHPNNMGRLAVGLPCICPATPLGITELLRRYDIRTQGMHCVVLGRSNIVGRPLSILLSSKEFNCTTTLCHSATQHIAQITRSADILVAAMGCPSFVDGSMIKEGAVVIDVGTSRYADNSAKNGYILKGDVNFEQAARKCSFITPVPGGVGPMTIAALLQNTLQIYLAQ